MGQAIRDFDDFDELIVSPDLQDVVDELRMLGLNSQTILAPLIEPGPLCQAQSRIVVSLDPGERAVSPNRVY